MTALMQEAHNDMATARQAAGLVDVVAGMPVLCLGRDAHGVAAQLAQRGAGVVTVVLPEPVRGSEFQPLPLTEGSMAAVVACYYLGGRPHTEAVLEDGCRVLAAHGRLVLVETALSGQVSRHIECWMGATLSNVIVGRSDRVATWMATGIVESGVKKWRFLERFRSRGRCSAAGSSDRSSEDQPFFAVHGERSRARNGACALR